MWNGGFPDKYLKIIDYLRYSYCVATRHARLNGRYAVRSSAAMFLPREVRRFASEGVAIFASLQALLRPRMFGACVTFSGPLLLQISRPSRTKRLGGPCGNRSRRDFTTAPLSSPMLMDLPWPLTVASPRRRQGVLSRRRLAHWPRCLQANGRCNMSSSTQRRCR